MLPCRTLIQVADSTMEDEYGDTYYVPYTDPDPDGPKLTGQLPASWASLTSLTNMYVAQRVVVIMMIGQRSAAASDVTCYALDWLFCSGTNSQRTADLR
jgi:hypothetical protein